MARRFFVRVQLHDVADGDDAYEDLHKAMEKEGFRRTITVRDQGEQRLPWGTYIGDVGKAGVTKMEAADHVRAAVRETGYTSSFVIVETDGALQVSSLEPVEQPRSVEEELQELLDEVRRLAK